MTIYTLITRTYDVVTVVDEHTALCANKETAKILAESRAIGMKLTNLSDWDVRDYYSRRTGKNDKGQTVSFNINERIVFDLIDVL